MSGKYGQVGNLDRGFKTFKVLIRRESYPSVSLIIRCTFGSYSLSAVPGITSSLNNAVELSL